jgi:hypothetical protein
MHEDAGSGDIPANTSQSTEDKRQGITQISARDASEPSRQKRDNDLPADNPVGVGSINWLGSSYSGADIKVVAHLYEEFDYKTLIADLQAQKQIPDNIAEALNRYINGGLQRFKSRVDSIRQVSLGFEPTWDEMRKIWESAGGITQKSSVVKGHMLDYLFKFGTAQYLLGYLQTLMTRDKEQQLALSKSLANRIDTLQQLQENASSTEVLASLQTISIQTHREKTAVRALGKSYAKGYTKGPRTIAGSMIFTVFNEHAFARLLKAMGKPGLAGEGALDTDVSTLIPDQLPPIDLTIVFANEYGSFSRMSIYGVEFVNDGKTMSIEDLMSEEVINFVARDVDIMTSIGVLKLSQAERGVWTVENGRDIEGSQLLREYTGSYIVAGKTTYQEYLKRLGVRRKYVGR